MYRVFHSVKAGQTNIKTREDTTNVIEIQNSEVIKIIKNLKVGKAVGPDSIHRKILKLFNINDLSMILKFFNGVYKFDKLVTDWLKSVFIHLYQRSTVQQTVKIIVQ